ncbi:MAG TPA: CocE/NonD family hydrolase, partial [Polyangiaceae bacterium]|nr:CocE/NonD family hydrolase [Polyangiaceae bacterium]
MLRAALPLRPLLLCPLLLGSCTSVAPAGGGPAGSASPNAGTSAAAAASAAALSSSASASASAAPAHAFTMTKAMVPVRDGVKLETVIFAPEGATKALPVLLVRTPYGLPKDTKVLGWPAMAALVADGYVFAWQSLRGRFASEGTFVMGRPPRDRADPRAVDEGTDAYDTIDWLVRNVPNNNGRVGMMGTSYDAWTATMALLEPHPALKAVVEEASPADQFVGDDFHHNGAFRLAYGFEYVALLESSKEANTKFSYGRGDLYDMFLELGPLANADARHFHGKMPTWNDFVAHPNRDEFWARRAFDPHLREAPVPVLNVAGWWDQEDFYGPFRIYDLLEKGGDAGQKNRLVVGPWNHGGWFGPGRRLGPIDFGADTGAHYRDAIRAPFLARWLHDRPAPEAPEASVFETG